MINKLLIIIGKIASAIVQKLNLGNGSTWPGHIALKVNKHFVRELLKKTNTKTIIVAGTNGKTTTSALIAHILKENGKSVMQNDSGANLLNGIASTIILNSNNNGALEKDFAIFEVDENALPLALLEINPDYVILLNLFRDQLDRYGEVHTIMDKWRRAFSTPKGNIKTTFILNADDPEIAFRDGPYKVVYFGLNENVKSKAILNYSSDSIYCPLSGDKLLYSKVFYSHLGIWRCLRCGLHRPDVKYSKLDFYPLPGIYNKYNTIAANAVLKECGLSSEQILLALKTFKPAFGRQEEIIVDGKKVRIFLSKNPTGFNESLRTIKELGAKHILFVLNDRIPDGRDVSWIWDTDIEGILDFSEHLIVSGDRTYDIGLRIKYALPSKFQISNFKFQIEVNLEKAIALGLKNVGSTGTLYILPTYTAMLETRKILTGKKIL